MPTSSSSLFPGRRKLRGRHSFTLVELLVVMGIIAILAAIAVPLIPSLLKANVVDSNVATLQGILEQARETAISSSSYVWVAFTDPSTTTPGDGIWVATFQSQDGTESPVNTTLTPAWLTTLTVPSANLQMVTKPQNLAGMKIVDPNYSTVPTSLTNLAASAGGVTNPATLFEPTGMQWTVSSTQYSEGNNATTYYTHAVEFTPDGEAHVQTWTSNIDFVMVPSSGSNTNNDVLMNLSRLTGKLTVYRP